MEAISRDIKQKKTSCIVMTILRVPWKMLQTEHVPGGHRSGNSIPNFIPMDNYMAMLSAAADFSC